MNSIYSHLEWLLIYMNLLLPSCLPSGCSVFSLFLCPSLSAYLYKLLSFQGGVGSVSPSFMFHASTPDFCFLDPMCVPEVYSIWLWNILFRYCWNHIFMFNFIKKYWSEILFFNKYLCFWYHSNTALIKWVGRCSLLSYFLEEITWNCVYSSLSKW